MNLQIESSTMNKADASNFLIRSTLTDEHGTERFSPPSLSLDADGYIQKCGKPIEAMFGYREHELALQHVSSLFPKFSEFELLLDGRLNPQLSYLCHCDHEFEAINKHGDTVVCNLNFFLVENKGLQNLRLIVRPVVKAQS